MLYIHPDECVDCGACEPVCPVEAIYYEDDVPDQWNDYTADQRRLLRRARVARAARPRSARSTTTRSWSRTCRLRARTDAHPRAARRDVSLRSSPGTPRRGHARLARAAPRRHRRPVGRHPGRPGPAGHREALAAASGRARLPDDRRHARARAISAVAAPGARYGITGLAEPPCCRRSAPRSSSPGCRRCSGSGADDLVVVPELAYPTYEVGARLAGAQVVAADSLTPARAAARVRWSGSTRRATRPGRCCASTTCARWSRGPASAASLVASDECYLGLGWDGPPRLGAAPVGLRRRPHRAAGRALAVQALHPGRLPGRLRRRRPGGGRASCWRCASTPG